MSTEQDVATNVAPDHENRFHQGMDAFRAGDYDQAIEVWGALSSELGIEHPHWAEIMWDMALAYLHRGEREMAWEIARQAGWPEDDFRKAEAAYLREQLDDVENRTRELDAQPPPDGPTFRTPQHEEWYRVAEAQYEAGNIGDAIDLYMLAFEGCTDYGTVVAFEMALKLSRCYLRLGRGQDALDVLTIVGAAELFRAEQLAALPPLVEAAEECYLTGNYATALSMFEQLLGAFLPGDPEYLDIVRDIGRCHVHLGEIDTAREWFPQAAMTDAEIEDACTIDQ